MVREFYVQLYTSENSTSCDTSSWSFPPLSHSDKRWLNQEVAAPEIKEVIFQMGANKASGPNGFLPSFFQKVLGHPWGLSWRIHKKYFPRGFFFERA